MLLGRDGPGDRDKAGILLSEADSLYRTMGMPNHAGMAEALYR